MKLMGTLAKAKANAAQGISELLETDVNKRLLENRDPRHIRNLIRHFADGKSIYMIFWI